MIVCDVLLKQLMLFLVIVFCETNAGCLPVVEDKGEEIHKNRTFHGFFLCVWLFSGKWHFFVVTHVMRHNNVGNYVKKKQTLRSVCSHIYKCVSCVIIDAGLNNEMWWGGWGGDEYAVVPSLQSLVGRYEEKKTGECKKIAMQIMKIKIIDKQKLKKI